MPFVLFVPYVALLVGLLWQCLDVDEETEITRLLNTEQKPKVDPQTPGQRFG